MYLIYECHKVKYINSNYHICCFSRIFFCYHHFFCFHKALSINEVSFFLSVFNWFKINKQCRARLRHSFYINNVPNFKNEINILTGKSFQQTSLIKEKVLTDNSQFRERITCIKRILFDRYILHSNQPLAA